MSKSTWQLTAEATRARRALIPEPADYARLRCVELVGMYHIALFTDRQARIFCRPRPGVNRGPIEIRLRAIEGTLTVRLSLGEVARKRRIRTKTQVTSTVARQLTALLGPAKGKTLISLDGSCSVRSLWWVPSDQASVITRWARRYDLADDAQTSSVSKILNDLGGHPVELPKFVREAVAVNDLLEKS